MKHDLWMPLPGQTWIGAGVAFVGMWIAMMAAMMLPSLAPVLWRYRQVLSAAGRWRRAMMLTLVVAGYLVVWGAVGAAIYPLGVALSRSTMTLPVLRQSMQILAALVVVVAGALQFSSWKSRHLACWRSAPVLRRESLPSHGAALRHGLRLGVHCTLSSAGPAAILLAVGVMDPGTMVLVTAAVTAERLMPRGERVARVIGGIAIAAGVLMLLLITTSGHHRTSRHVEDHISGSRQAPSVGLRTMMTTTAASTRR